jgi:hypothetical protein
MTRREAGLFSFFFLLPALFFFFPFLQGKTHFAGDVFYSFHPWLTYAAQNVQAGRFPLWDPYSACGTPFLINPQIMLLYPGAILFWLFPYAAAWNAFLVMNQALLFLAVYALARRWRLGPGPAVLAGAAAAWSGFAAVHWEFAAAGATLPFLALVLLFSLARAGPLTALAVGLLFLSGYTPFAPYGLLVAGFAVAAKSLAPLLRRRAMDWRPAAAWARWVALGLAAALVLILPCWEGVKQSLRVDMSPAEARGYLLSPAFLIKFLIPDIFDKSVLPIAPQVFDTGSWAVQRNWLNTFFIGTPPLLLALVALAKVRAFSVGFLAFVALLFSTLAMGWEPVFSFLRQVVPGVRYMSHFSNAMVMVVLALALLSGYGLRALERHKVTFFVVWGLTVLPSLGLALFPSWRLEALQALLDIPKLSNGQDAWVASAARRSLAGLVLLALCVLAPRRFRAASVISLTLAQLWLFGRDVQPVTKAGFFHEQVFLAQVVDKQAHRISHDPRTVREGPRMAGANPVEGYQSLRQILDPNTHLPYRVPATWGYEVFPLQAFSQFRRPIDLTRDSPAKMNFLGASHIVATERLPAPYQLVNYRENALLYQNFGAQPRVTAVPRAVVLPEPSERLAYLTDPWNPAREVVLEKAVDATAVPRASSASLQTWREEAGRMEASGRGPGWLVYSQVFYPGWEAYVDGRRAELRRANHAFQAVQVPDRDWTAVLMYRPRLFRLGLGLSLLAWLILGTIGGRQIFRLARTSPARPT